MKRLIILLVTVLFTVISFSQFPEKISYQAVVRNSSGLLIRNSPIGIKISIIPEAKGISYSETHIITTNNDGLVTLEIGGGNVVSGTFSAINWSDGTYSLMTEVDPEGGTNYTITGTSQILTVPYALYAKTADYNSLSNKPVLFDGIWTSITGKPTTLTGYGITDAVATTGNQTIAGDKTFSNKLIVSQEGIGTSAPDASAALEIKSTTQGFLLPRMTEAQIYALTPAEGLIVYNTTSKNLYFFGDGKWYEFTSKVCVPEPTASNAGSDQLILVTTTNLTGNTPVYGSGTWITVAGTGGTVADVHNPASSFTGILGHGYILRWTISTPCNNSNDEVNISLGPPCSNGIIDGTESDIDCGGTTCNKCSTGFHCNSSSDCISYICSGSVCVAPTCTDKVRNGLETDIDCGGITCTKCAPGKVCLVNTDCVSGVCTGSICMVPTCTDKVRNGVETDVDCGGITCSKCASGSHCNTGSDCISLVCTGSVCMAPTCTDKVRNGLETDIDCGGITCTKCAPGKVCLVNTDCVSGICTGSICTAPTCTDKVKNGLETDIDCGGTTCTKCAAGKVCLVNTDCLSGTCSGGHCL